MLDPSPEELAAEIRDADRNVSELGPRYARLWERIQIAPTPWRQSEYPAIGAVWVIGILGTRCLCYNPAECGWGWGRFTVWGEIETFHWQQDEIHHAISFMLSAIDHGGTL